MHWREREREVRSSVFKPPLQAAYTSPARPPGRSPASWCLHPCALRLLFDSRMSMLWGVWSCPFASPASQSSSWHGLHGCASSNEVAHLVKQTRHRRESGERDTLTRKPETGDLVGKARLAATAVQPGPASYLAGLDSLDCRFDT